MEKGQSQRRHRYTKEEVLRQLFPEETEDDASISATSYEHSSDFETESEAEYDGEDADDSCRPSTSKTMTTPATSSNSASRPIYIGPATTSKQSWIYRSIEY